MIKNIIFDIGGVLLNYNPLKFLEDMYDDTDMVNRLYDCIFASKEWVRLDEGTMTIKEAVDIFASRFPGISEEIHMVMKNWQSMFVPIIGTVDILKKLKTSGFGLYYLSNFHDEASRYVTEKYDFWKEFDGGIFSFAENMVKPNPEIYHTLLERYSLNATDCIFIDDMPQNIKAAEAAGITGIVFENPCQLELELELKKLTEQHHPSTDCL